MTPTERWQAMLAELPLIAILRGIQPYEALDVAEAICEAGFLCLEIPLNSPKALSSIEIIRSKFDGRMLVGAGTVVKLAEVAQIHQAGAEFVVSPNTNLAIIEATKDLGLCSAPGFFTPSEAFAAVNAGADALKLFPAEAAPPAVLRAMKAILPTSLPVFAVGGISTETMRAYIQAGANGFGIGGALYKPGLSPTLVSERAASFVTGWRNL